ncbi:MAG: glycosyltransferase [Candidatus Delongbacteria bacterium]|nr:glycosyltransferase [Candidatus Delongbacteria bacterium]
MKSNQHPSISVIMSVYNGELYLNESINSILKQTFQDFKFIITDDCSTDNSLSIIEKYMQDDDRIILMKNKENFGLTKNLNRMLAIASGKYIARMDADDISLPTRFEKQYEYLEKYPEIGVLGTNISFFGISKHITSLPVDNEKIRVALLFENVIMHPSVMIRISVLTDNKLTYDESFKISQDYDLWCRLQQKTKFNNLKDVLLRYRFENYNITNSTSKDYRNSYLKQIFSNQLNTLGIEPTDKELLMHIAFSKGKPMISFEDVIVLKKWLLNILQYNRKYKIYKESTLEYTISRYWFVICTSSTNLGFGIFKNYYTLKLKNRYKPSCLLFFKFFIKSLVKYGKR